MKMIYQMCIVLLAGSFTVEAQEFIPLSETDFNRLAIVLAPVEQVNRQAGNRFPATVVNSPDSVSTVTAPFSGVVQGWEIVPGQKVEAGSVLAVIRSEEILELQSQWLIAQSELEQADFAKVRDDRLLEQGIVSLQRSQQTNRDYQQVQLKVNAIEGRLARAGIDDMALEQLQEHSNSLGLYFVHSPEDGALTHRALAVGEYVSDYGELASIQSSGQPWLSVHLPARLAAGLSPGQDLSLAGTGETLTLRQKDFLIDETTQTVEILAQFNSPVSYLAGQVLTVILAPVDTGVLIPASGVVHSGDATIVYVQVGQGVEARSLVLQPAGNNYVASSGISVGEQVVIQGASVLKGMQLGLGRDE